MGGTRDMRVLVTGATGFLGSNALKALSAHPGVEAIAACREPARLPGDFAGEVRTGDLMDPGYRKDVVKGIDVVCNAASQGSLWGHRKLERERFLAPAADLIERSIRQGVRRFVQASTIALGSPAKDGSLRADASPARPTGFWPHLDLLIELDRYMRGNSSRGTQMVTLRLGHFAGAGNRIGLIPTLVPRLRTHLTPWLANGRSRLPLVGDTDLGAAFALAALAGDLGNYESFNICGPELPTLRDVISYVARESDSPAPHFSVPYPAGYAFGLLTEVLNPVLPGSSPFLTRSIVYLAEDWPCSADYAASKLGYAPAKEWRTAVSEQLRELAGQGYPWPRLSQF